MILFFDWEVFKYDNLVVIIEPIEQKEYVFVNDRKGFVDFYNKHKNDIWCGYNVRNYDQYITKAAICGFDLKAVNDWIIVKDRKGFEYSSLFNKVRLNIYDVMPNPPVSLKTLEGFMGNNIHETSVSFDIDRKLTDIELEETIKYCRFDVLNTIEVFIRRKNEFDSQMQLVKTFNLPLSHLGKTQAQLAAIILGAKKKKLKDEWNIRLPDNVLLGKYKEVGDWFLNKENHNVDAKLEITICGIPHTIAWGGIHAGLSKTQVYCSPDEVIFDVDVDQLYPSLMIEYNLLSRAVEEPKKFQNILDKSLELKKLGKKKEREPYKRICNITYGAEGDKFNPMYDPLHRNLVCVFGQVFIIDLLDKVEDIITLLNSNTDGIFVKLKRKDVDEFKRRVHGWEERTRLHMSYDEFSCMYSKDVNNYVGIRPDGSYHSKGAYVKDLNPLDYDLPIVNEAVKDYIIKKIPVENTILGCNELIKFQKVVKLSNKYKWVEHEKGDSKEKFDNKCYRVFASKDQRDGRILKCDGVRNPAKFGNTPDRCFIVNDDITKAKTDRFPQLDKQYYVDLAKKRLEDFGVNV
jgi:hypothetical protein